MNDERANNLVATLLAIALLCWGGWWLWTNVLNPPASHVCIGSCAQQAEQFDRAYERGQECDSPPADSSANEGDNERLAQQQQDFCDLP